MFTKLTYTYIYNVYLQYIDNIILEIKNMDYKFVVFVKTKICKINFFLIFILDRK